MKIVLDTADVKVAITEYIERRNIVQKGAPMDLQIVKLRNGDNLEVNITLGNSESTEEAPITEETDAPLFPVNEDAEPEEIDSKTESPEDIEPNPEDDPFGINS